MSTESEAEKARQKEIEKATLTVIGTVLKVGALLVVVGLLAWLVAWIIAEVVASHLRP